MMRPGEQEAIDAALHAAVGDDMVDEAREFVSQVVEAAYSVIKDAVLAEDQDRGRLIGDE